MTKQGWRQFCAVLLMSSNFSAFADTNNEYCIAGPTAFINIINRPTFGDSPCTAPPKKLILEMGYQYLNLVEGIKGESYPFSQLRYGLSKKSELFVFLPDYINLSLEHASGLSEVAVGLKHQFFNTSRMIFTLDASVIPSSGSRTFGSKGWGTVINSIFSFNITKNLSFTTQLGFSSMTLSVREGGRRFTSVNPDAFFSWFPVERLELFAEIYGATKTAPEEHSGFNASVGMIYLVTKNMTIDFEGGQRMRGFLGAIENYVSAGTSIQFN